MLENAAKLKQFFENALISLVYKLDLSIGSLDDLQGPSTGARRRLFEIAASLVRDASRSRAIEC